MELEGLEVGDKVRLAGSETPQLTVGDEPRHGRVRCYWIVDSKDVRTEEIPLALLERFPGTYRRPS